MEFSSVGRNLRRFRLEKKLRQEELAERTGLSTNYIGMIERTEKIPSLETFITILNALEVSADMVLSDVLTRGYTVKDSMLDEKLSTLKKKDRDCIYAVIDTMIRHL